MEKFNEYAYIALDEQGREYVRPARTINELPTPELRMAATKKAKEVLNLNVNFGVKLGESNNCKRSEIDSDESGFLSKRGCELPLSIF